MKKIVHSLAALIVCALTSRAEILPPGPERLNAQIDFNGDRVLDYDEIIFAITRKEKGTGDILAQQAMKRAPKAPPVDKLDPRVSDVWLTIVDIAVPIAAGDPPRYRLDAINPRRLGLEKMMFAAPTQIELKQQPYIRDFNYKVRRSAGDLKKPLNDPFAQGALFSFAQDYNTNEDQWAARGVVSFEYSVTQNPAFEGPSSKELDANRPGVFDTDRFFLRSAAYRLNIAFDKVSTGGGNRGEVDTLDLFATAAYWWHLPDKNPTGILGITADVSGHYLTDFSGEKAVYAGTIDVEPITGLPGHGVYKFLWKRTNRFNEKEFLLGFRWSASLHFEAGTVQDANMSPNLMNYDAFSRVGGKVGLEMLLLPDALQSRLSLTADYTHHEALQDEVPSTHLFAAALQYVFPVGSGLYAKNAPKKNEEQVMTERDMMWTLRLEYTNGTTPLVADDDHHLLIGLGVAF
jgi:hypothetical protein